MSGLLDSLAQSIGPEQVQAISKHLGATPQQTEQAISLALPTLVGALARHSDTNDGAQQIQHAMQQNLSQQNLSGGLLEQLGGMLSGGAGSNNSASGGLGGLGSLLEMVLGRGQGRVEQGIGKASGLNASQVTALLAMLAPMILSALSRMRSQSNSQDEDVSSVLRKERKDIENKAGGGLLSGLLDQDGDGDFDLKDMLAFGMKTFFRR